ncbi:multicopper oxidase mco [Variibacter gotjawalensis]|uniref:Multicopper oxidase mco n=1 Tax=Variibacter gotjawalensis TaxID=1333996 RepID=A0A0S3PX45_9BRAD|nr:multicopper oxidase family protein [Variibacter gotjawalensis]NIK46339.1 FtsP/CotA-like multicopper oxidase with cupredoxin domain [Variibacter gotjawalensis]RZS48249.1 FtsP/CotA-like multicopper oxidase with cupredoxin domain [Variibacter gotjawalensis]BAT60509.1 multicopper oxidase mco [Variibacter gotjawalensis]
MRAKPLKTAIDGLASGFDGVFPGPALRATRGKPFSATFGNDLTAPVSIYFPGLRSVRDPVLQLAPGQTGTFSLAPRDAGTFWYRALPSGQAANGLCGLLIVDDGVAVDRDVPLVINVAGDKRTANGHSGREIPVRAGERVRLRILNASPAEMMAVRLDQHDVNVMALDGHPSEPFIARDGRVPLAPGNRADLFVDMTMPAGTIAPLMVETLAGAAQTISLKYSPDAPAKPAPSGPPTVLPPNPLNSRMEFGRAQRAELALDPASPPALSAKKGQTVMLALTNSTPIPQAVHIGGTPFRLLDSMDDGWKPYWLDTVVALPQRTTRIAFVAEATGSWPIISQPLQPGAAASIGSIQIS